MHPAIKILSLLSIISFALGGLAGCGGKKVHVATSSGTPGQEMPVEFIDMEAEGPTAGLGADTSLDESDLSTRISNIEMASEEPPISFASIMPNEPVNMAHEAKTVAIEDTSFNAPIADPRPSSTPEPEFTEEVSALTSEPEPEFTKEVSAFTEDDEALPPLSEGQDFSSQSHSTLETNAPDISNKTAGFREDTQRPLIEPSSDLIDSPFSQDISDGVQNSFTEETIAPVPDAFVIAKAQPSDSLQDQINRIKKEEFATAAAGLQDVFFPFDSWTLTKEGKHSLKRTLSWFQQDFSSVLIIEGHSDQRGTQAYNMILGKRRALAVRDYLSQAGIDPSHLITISYGKDKPFCQDITEVCHQLNRRGHLLVKNR